MPAISASAPGKTILFGEHAVVYGSPAIAIPISSLRIKAIIQPNIESQDSVVAFNNGTNRQKFNIHALPPDDLIRGIVSVFEEQTHRKLSPFTLTIHSEIPIAAGLGSSAAVAVAVTRTLGEFSGLKLNGNEINEFAYKSEIVQHGTPSGIDNSVITYEKPIYFEKGMPIQTITIKNKLHFVLADSGERTLTKKVVDFVRESMEKDHTNYQNLLFSISDICRIAKNAIMAGDAHVIGKLMIQNHSLLQKMGVSSQKLDKLVDLSLQAGAFGAKLCGGGQGGFMVSICDKETVDTVTDQLRKISSCVIKASIGGLE